MSNVPTIHNARDYVNYVFNISARGVSEVTSQVFGLSSTVQNVLGNLAFKTSEYLSHAESTIVSFGVAAAGAYIGATQRAIDFQQATANVEAISGKQLVGSDVGRQAMEMSNKFGMAIEDMTTGLEALARAGITANSSINALLESGTQMAKFEGTDLESSMNDLIATVNLLTPELDTNSDEYARRVEEINQHIISTSESSPINAQNIINSLQHVGGYASSTNLDQDDLFAVIAQMGSKGTKGEITGTSLRAFVSAGQKDTAQRALKRIGLNVTDLWSDDGQSLLSISQMKDVLDTALEAKGFSKQQKLEFYSDFVGYKQANQIMKINTKEVERYRKAIDDAMSVTDKMGIVLGTVQGNWSQIKNTALNFMTKVGSKLLPVINAMLIPVKMIVGFIDKIPFADWAVTGGLLLVITKGIAKGIQVLVPTMMTFIYKFTDLNKSSFSISNIFEKWVEDLKQAKNILNSMGDKEKMNKIINIREAENTNKYLRQLNEKDAINEILRQKFGYHYNAHNGKIDGYKWDRMGHTEQEYYRNRYRPPQDLIDKMIEERENRLDDYWNNISRMPHVGSSNHTQWPNIDDIGGVSYDSMFEGDTIEFNVSSISENVSSIYDILDSWNQGSSSVNDNSSSEGKINISYGESNREKNQKSYDFVLHNYATNIRKNFKDVKDMYTPIDESDKHDIVRGSNKPQKDFFDDTWGVKVLNPAINKYLRRQKNDYEMPDAENSWYYAEHGIKSISDFATKLGNDMWNSGKGLPHPSVISRSGQLKTSSTGIGVLTGVTSTAYDPDYASQYGAPGNKAITIYAPTGTKGFDNDGGIEFTLPPNYPYIEISQSRKEAEILLLTLKQIHQLGYNPKGLSDNPYRIPLDGAIGNIEYSSILKSHPPDGLKYIESLVAFGDEINEIMHLQDDKGRDRYYQMVISDDDKGEIQAVTDPKQVLLSGNPYSITVEKPKLGNSLRGTRERYDVNQIDELIDENNIYVPPYNENDSILSHFVPRKVFDNVLQNTRAPYQLKGQLFDDYYGKDTLTKEDMSKYEEKLAMFRQIYKGPLAPVNANALRHIDYNENLYPTVSNTADRIKDWMDHGELSATGMTGLGESDGGRISLNRYKLMGQNSDIIMAVFAHELGHTLMQQMARSAFSAEKTMPGLQIANTGFGEEVSEYYNRFIEEIEANYIELGVMKKLGYNEENNKVMKDSAERLKKHQEYLSTLNIDIGPQFKLADEVINEIVENIDPLSEALEYAFDFGIDMSDLRFQALAQKVQNNKKIMKLGAAGELQENMSKLDEITEQFYQLSTDKIQALKESFLTNFSQELQDGTYYTDFPIEDKLRQLSVQQGAKMSLDELSAYFLYKHDDSARLREIIANSFNAKKIDLEDNILRDKTYDSSEYRDDFRDLSIRMREVTAANALAKAFLKAPLIPEQTVLYRVGDYESPANGLGTFKGPVSTSFSRRFIENGEFAEAYENPHAIRILAPADIAAITDAIYNKTAYMDAMLENEATLGPRQNFIELKYDKRHKYGDKGLPGVTIGLVTPEMIEKAQYDISSDILGGGTTKGSKAQIPDVLFNNIRDYNAREVKNADDIIERIEYFFERGNVSYSDTLSPTTGGLAMPALGVIQINDAMSAENMFGIATHELTHILTKYGRNKADNPQGKILRDESQEYTHETFDYGTYTNFGAEAEANIVARLVSKALGINGGHQTDQWAFNRENAFLAQMYENEDINLDLLNPLVDEMINNTEEMFVPFLDELKKYRDKVNSVNTPQSARKVNRLDKTIEEYQNILNTIQENNQILKQYEEEGINFSELNFTESSQRLIQNAQNEGNWRATMSADVFDLAASTAAARIEKEKERINEKMRQWRQTDDTWTYDPSTGTFVPPANDTLLNAYKKNLTTSAMTEDGMNFAVEKNQRQLFAFLNTGNKGKLLKNQWEEIQSEFANAKYIYNDEGDSEDDLLLQSFAGLNPTEFFEKYQSLTRDADKMRVRNALLHYGENTARTLLSQREEVNKTRRELIKAADYDLISQKFGIDLGDGNKEEKYNMLQQWFKGEGVGRERDIALALMKEHERPLLRTIETNTREQNIALLNALSQKNYDVSDLISAYGSTPGYGNYNLFLELQKRFFAKNELGDYLEDNQQQIIQDAKEILGGWAEFGRVAQYELSLHFEEINKLAKQAQININNINGEGVSVSFANGAGSNDSTSSDNETEPEPEISPEAQAKSEQLKDWAERFKAKIRDKVRSFLGYNADVTLPEGVTAPGGQSAKNIHIAGNKYVEKIRDKLLPHQGEFANMVVNSTGKIDSFTDSLKIWQQAFDHASEAFPPFTVAAMALSSVIGTLTTVSNGLKLTLKTLAEMKTLTGVFEMFKGTALEEPIHKLGAGLEAALGGVIKSVITYVSGLSLTAIAAIGGVLIAIGAIVGALKWSQDSHDKYLATLQEENKTITAQDKANQAAVKNLKEQKKHGYGRTQTNKDYLARRYELAEKKLEASQKKRYASVIKMADQENDALWGTYGLRADFQKMGWLESIMAMGVPFLGTVAKMFAGEFQSTAENYTGTTEQVRKIKEHTTGNWFATDAQRYVSSYYDAHQPAFAMMDNYKSELGELYDKESKFIKMYGSKEAARNNKRFQKAVDDFTAATGINKETAFQMLDYMQTEHVVEQATSAMQATADSIVAGAELQALAIANGASMEDAMGLNGQGAMQDAMIQAQADMIKQEAADTLWWKATWTAWTAFFYRLISPITIIVTLMQYLWSIISNLDIIIYDAVTLGQGPMSDADRRRLDSVKKARGNFESALGDAVGLGREGRKAMAYQAAYDKLQNTDLYDEGVAAIGNDDVDRADYGSGGKAAVTSTGFNVPKNKYLTQPSDSTSTTKHSQQVGQAYTASYGPLTAYAGTTTTAENLFGVNGYDAMNRSLQEISDKTGKSRSLLASIDNGDNLWGRMKNHSFFRKGEEAFDKSLRKRQKEVSSTDIIKSVFANLKNIIPIIKDVSVDTIKQKGKSLFDTIKDVNKINSDLKKVKKFYDAFKEIGWIDKAKNVLSKIIHPDRTLRGKERMFLNPETFEITKVREGGLWQKGKEGIKGAYSAYKEAGSLKSLLSNSKMATKLSDQIALSREINAWYNGGANIERSLFDIGVNAYDIGKSEGLSGLYSAGRGAINAQSLASLGKSGLGVVKSGIKGGLKGVPLIGTLISAGITFGEEYIEHDPSKTHYNEDGTEKGAFQATGEVVGSVGGSVGGMLAGSALGATIGSVVPGIGTAIGTVAGGIIGGIVGDKVMRQWGDAIGGTLGWVADQTVNSEWFKNGEFFNYTLPGLFANGLDQGAKMLFGDNNPVSNFIDDMKAKGGEYWQWIREAAGGVLGGFIDWLGGVTKGLSDWWSSEEVQGTVNGIGDFLADIPIFGGASAIANLLGFGSNKQEQQQQNSEQLGNQIGTAAANKLKSNKQGYFAAHSGFTSYSSGNDSMGTPIHHAIASAVNDASNYLDSYDKATNLTKSVSDGNKTNYTRSNTADNLKTKNANKSSSSIVIENISINTDDDPEKIKTALMNLVIELQEQVSPRLVSRTIGEPPSTSSDIEEDTNLEEDENVNSNSTNNNPIA